MRDPSNTLFLCSGNSARSIIAEAILNVIGEGRFRAYSAGSQPKGKVNPYTLRLLDRLGYDVSGLHSKSWDEFARKNAPEFDLLITVCDNAAGESCPIWPGKPVSVHWGIPDPAAATGTDAEIAVAFNEAYRMLYERISAFVALPFHSLDGKSLREELLKIGRMEGATVIAKDAH